MTTPQQPQSKGWEVEVEHQWSDEIRQLVGHVSIKLGSDIGSRLANEIRNTCDRHTATLLAEERSRIGDIVELVLEKYKDTGDEMYGLAKHNNTILRCIEDDIKALVEKETVVE